MRPTLLRLAVILFAWTVSPATDAARAEPGGTAIAAVPGLQTYLTKRFGKSWRAKRHVFQVRLINLDASPEDKIDEVLLSVNQYDPEYCSNNGCSHEVLVRQPDGSLKAVASFTGYGLRIADTVTNGVRDLISETLRGNRRFNLAGQTSGSARDKSSEPASKDI